MYTIYGYTISSKEQALSLLMLVTLKGDKRIAEQIMAILPKLS